RRGTEDEDDSVRRSPYPRPAPLAPSIGGKGPGDRGPSLPLHDNEITLSSRLPAVDSPAQRRL
ncbi:MAG: hypothetical protein NTZ05_11945, partial [Chloroflexi bacterium]|nr:hypothetical protein [Chloroflexota bacterium]